MTGLSTLLSIPTISTLILSAIPISAYIPAKPINDTSGLNLTDSSTISISWQNPAGSYTGSVSYQLQADIPTNGTTSGALVHFTENGMGQNLTTDTPWIAFISCDRNETGASNEWDIFTLARDRGAVSALLYTTQSTSCLLNSHYIRDFEKPLDVFATKTFQVAQLIDNQFRHTNETFFEYNGTLLNVSGAEVNQSLAGSTFNLTTYLTGALVARNSTGQAFPTEIPNPTSSSSPNSSSGPPVSMVVLYVVVCLIAIAFISMLCLGWRRARRHPERYGQTDSNRAGGDSNNGRPTAAGIAQAMLDTFPVIKFRSNRNNTSQNSSPASGEINKAKSLRSEADSVALLPVPLAAYSPDRPKYNKGETEGSLIKQYDSIDRIPSLKSNRLNQPSRNSLAWDVRPTSGPSSRPSSSSHSMAYTLDNDLMTISEKGGKDHLGVGNEGLVRTEDVEDGNTPDICPICLVEFEEGEDIRVLPCEKEHMYHQSCIDPWLLRVSGSCPLCRKDFNNPTESPPAESPEENPTSQPTQSNPTSGGFAKYLIFMRRQRRESSNTSSSNNQNSSNRRRAGTSATTASGATTGPLLGRTRNSGDMGDVSHGRSSAGGAGGVGGGIEGVGYSEDDRNASLVWGNHAPGPILSERNREGGNGRPSA